MSETLGDYSWQIRPSMLQNAEQQRTHTRRLPLPATLDAYVCGCHFRALYRGHGLDKVAYLLEGVHPNDGHPSSLQHSIAGKVLKLCKEADPEPKLFAEHGGSGVYPRIFAAAPVFELDSVAQPVSQWNGWITDLAVPLDQALRQPGLSREAAGRCVVGAVRCMLRAAIHGHSMDDPSPCNFGMLGGDVVIIDAGRRPPREKEMSKSQFNKGLMRKFFARAGLSIAPEDLARYRGAWQNASTMADAHAAFDSLWDSVAEAEFSLSSRAGQPAPASVAARPRTVLSSSSAEQPAPWHLAACPHVAEAESGGSSRAGQPAPRHLAACPHVAAAFDELSDEVLEWLTHNFLWDKLSRYGLLSDGAVGYLADSHCTAEVKLELLIRLTTGRREKICNDSSIDILSEEELGRALNDWKDDYEQWMHPQTLRDSWGVSRQSWHQMLRRAFRTFLFHISGSYELSIFFLAAPFSGRNLELFRSSWNSSVTRTEALQKAKDALRQAAGSIQDGQTTQTKYLCVYLCMYLCMHVSVYVSMYECIHVCIYVCIYVCNDVSSTA